VYFFAEYHLIFVWSILEAICRKKSSNLSHCKTDPKWRKKGERVTFFQSKIEYSIDFKEMMTKQSFFRWIKELSKHPGSLINDFTKNLDNILLLSTIVILSTRVVLNLLCSPDPKKWKKPYIGPLKYWLDPRIHVKEVWMGTIPLLWSSRTPWGPIGPRLGNYALGPWRHLWMIPNFSFINGKLTLILFISQSCFYSSFQPQKKVFFIMVLFFSCNIIYVYVCPTTAATAANYYILP
jgi:hypothetical protein